MGTRDSGQGPGRVKRMLTNVCFMAERPSFHVTVNTPLCVSGISYKESRRRIWSNASGVVTVVTAGRRGCLSGGFSRHPRQSDREGDRQSDRERKRHQSTDSRSRAAATAAPERGECGGRRACTLSLAVPVPGIPVTVYCFSLPSGVNVLRGSP